MGERQSFLSAVWASGVLSRQFPHIQVNCTQRECTLNLNPNTLSGIQLWLFLGGREEGVWREVGRERVKKGGKKEGRANYNLPQSFNLGNSMCWKKRVVSQLLPCSIPM